jgi:hypothetical protein
MYWKIILINPQCSVVAISRRRRFFSRLPIVFFVLSHKYAPAFGIGKVKSITIKTKTDNKEERGGWKIKQQKY